MSHEHDQGCAHDLKFCYQCDVAYCGKCDVNWSRSHGWQWVPGTTIMFPEAPVSLFPNTPPIYEIGYWPEPTTSGNATAVLVNHADHGSAA